MNNNQKNIFKINERNNIKITSSLFFIFDNSLYETPKKYLLAKSKKIFRSQLYDGIQRIDKNELVFVLNEIIINDDILFNFSKEENFSIEKKLETMLLNTKLFKIITNFGKHGWLNENSLLLCV
jgi:hypothetical protein